MRNLTYVMRRPKAPLAEFVEYLWIDSDYRPAHRFERVLPEGTVEIVINLTDDVLACYDPDTLKRIDVVNGPLIAGPLERFTVYDTKRKIEIMGAHFHPGSAGDLLGTPVSEIGGLEISLADCWGPAAVELRERLAATSDAGKRLDILEAALMARLWKQRGKMKVHGAVAAALPVFELLESPVRMGDLAANLGLSSRRFIEVFSAQVGMTPKAYGRVRRFQGAIDRIHREARPCWTSVALDCGYYDQGHFIREFKAISGLTPRAFAPLRGERKNRLPVPDRPEMAGRNDEERVAA